MSSGPAALRCGLIGEHLGHSYSQRIHNAFGKYDYFLQELAPDEVAAFLRNGDYQGLNVTIPYKKAAMACCDELTPAARLAGAVNAIRKDADGRLRGHNTDIGGFRHLCARAGIVLQGRKVLVLGSGGAAGTVCAVAAEDDAREIVTVSRKGPFTYENVSLQHPDAQVVINATPCGMYPDNAGCPPIRLEDFPSLEGVADLIYNPARTMFLQEAQARGLACGNGLSMLVEQARLAAEFWLGSSFPRLKADKVLTELRRDTMNIALVGMPGCGKSSVGRMIAKWSGREFVDTDKMIVKDAQMSIPQIFEQEGEAAFREREARAVAEAARRGGIVLATGGGAVLNPLNRRLLKANSIVVWLKRPVEELATKGRPLSKGLDELEEMARARKPFYADVADAEVDNRWETPIGSVARKALQAFEKLTEGMK